MWVGKGVCEAGNIFAILASVFSELMKTSNVGNKGVRRAWKQNNYNNNTNNQRCKVILIKNRDKTVPTNVTGNGPDRVIQRKLGTVEKRLFRKKKLFKISCVAQ